jgi:hypothetical protein
MVTSAHRVEVEVGAGGPANAPLPGRRRCAASGRSFQNSFEKPHLYPYLISRLVEIIEIIEIMEHPRI